MSSSYYAQQLSIFIIDGSDAVLQAIIITRTYVSGADIHPHMPIRRPHAARYTANVFKFHERRMSSVTFKSAHLYGNVYMRVGLARALASSSDFGFLGQQSSQKFVIPCLGRR